MIFLERVLLVYHDVVIRLLLGLKLRRSQDLGSVGHLILLRFLLLLLFFLLLLF